MPNRKARTSLSIGGILIGTLMLGLAGCIGGSEDPALQPDWIDTRGEALPVPTPTTPAPTPTATSTPPPPISDLYTGPAEVAKYVEKFVDDAKAEGVDVLPDMKNPKLEIRVASLDSYGSSVIGLCETGGGKRRVTFDPDFWNSVSETQKELLAHHELGHCVLYRAHKTTLLSSGAYASIMYPIIMSSSTYLNNSSYYLEELFGQALQQLSDPSAEGVHVCNEEELRG